MEVKNTPSVVSNEVLELQFEAPNIGEPSKAHTSVFA